MRWVARAAKEPDLIKPAAAGAVLSSVATVVQLGILIAATDLAVLDAFLMPLLFSGVAAIVYGGAFTLWALREKRGEVEETQGSAFSLKTALIFAAHPGRRPAARRGLAGLDGRGRRHHRSRCSGIRRHACALDIGRVAGRRRKADGHRPPWSRSSPPSTTNTVTKMVFAFTAGGARFALYVVPGQLLMLAAAWAAMLVA